MSERYTNIKIKLTLSNLRSKIRNGVVAVSYRDNGIMALRSAVAVAFGYGTGYQFTDLTDFNPQTVRRFQKLFEVPVYSVVTWEKPVYPSQDETATALQNFINRRSDPWAHVRRVPENETVLATEVSPINV